MRAVSAIGPRALAMIAAGAGLAIGMQAAPAVAQTYPSKPIRIIATSTPGSVVDVFGRAIGEHWSKAFGQTVVVENRAGAGGTLAAGRALAAEPDGYTVMVNTSAHVVAPFIFPNTGFDLIKDFAGVSPLAILPNVLVVPAQRPWKTVKDLVSAAQAKPGGYTYATAGTGTGTHMSAERFRLSAGITAVQVTYKGSPEVMVDLIGGRVDWTLAPTSTVLPMMRDGRIRGIALSGLRRSPQLPDLPTLRESGLHDPDFLFWVGVFMPVKAPRLALVRLYEETAKALAMPETRERFERLGGEVFAMKPEEFDTFIRTQAELAGGIVKAANIKAN